MMNFTSGPGILFGWGPGIFWVLAILCAPVASVKAAISVIQLVAAMRNVAVFDVEERVQLAEASRHSKSN